MVKMKIQSVHLTSGFQLLVKIIHLTYFLTTKSLPKGIHLIVNLKYRNEFVFDNRLNKALGTNSKLPFQLPFTG